MSPLPADAFFWPAIPPDPGWSTAKCFNVDSAGQVQSDVSGGSASGTTSAGPCNLSSVPLHVELRGSDCLDCPAVFDLGQYGSGSVPFSGSQTGFAEYCVSTAP